MAEQFSFTILSKKPGYLIFRFDVGAPMDPAVVLSNIGADALELTTEKYLMIRSEMREFYINMALMINE